METSSLVSQVVKIHPLAFLGEISLVLKGVVASSVSLGVGPSLVSPRAENGNYGDNEDVLVSGQGNGSETAGVAARGNGSRTADVAARGNGSRTAGVAAQGNGNEIFGPFFLVNPFPAIRVMGSG